VAIGVDVEREGKRAAAHLPGGLLVRAQGSRRRCAAG
jgi:hypothetical protein